MAEVQTLDPYAVDESKTINIAPREWFFFKEEVKDQLAEGKFVKFTDEEWEAFVNAQDVH